MSAQEFRLRVGDRLPKLRMTITVGGLPLDLTAAAISLMAANRSDGAPVTMTGMIAVINASQGLVEYAFSVGDTATQRVLSCHWRVEWIDGRLSAPANCPLKIIID